MRLWTLKCLALVACLIGPFAMRGSAQVTLAWNPSVSPGVAGYNVCWGTNSGNYVYTNNYTNTVTNVTIPGLAANQVFFFAVQAVSTNGLVSDFSNEESYTNVVQSPPTNTAPPTNAPATNGPTTNIVQNPPTNTAPTTNIVQNPPTNTAPPTNVVQSTPPATPLFLGLVGTNGQANLTWDASTSPGVASYNLGWGTNSGNYIYTNNYTNTITNATISGLVTNQVYFFAVQAVSTNGLISDFSNEESYTNLAESIPTTNAPPTNAPPTNIVQNPPTNTTPPTNIVQNPPTNTTPPTNVVQATPPATPLSLGLIGKNGQVNLAWDASTSPGVASYNLGWGTNSGIYVYTNNYTNSITNATISDLATNQVYFFAVQAVSTNGLISDFSNEESYTNLAETVPTTNAPPTNPPPTNGPTTNIVQNPPTNTAPPTNVVQATPPSPPLSLGLAGTNGQAYLTWILSASPGVASYNACWGTNSGNYIYTNNYTNTITNATISDLTTNQVFFFAVQAVSTNGLASDFSNEESYTNTAPPATPGGPGGPPAPPGGGPGLPTNANPPVVVNPGGGGTSTNMTQTNFWGVPPSLGLSVSNGQANLIINGTVGAMLNIVGTTNELSMNEWSAVTNLTLTNIASTGDTNQQGQPQDVLEVAFVPGTQTVALGNKGGGGFQYFQVVMPYDYAILADQVLLANSNYTPRLILVNMPGLVDDACYVNQASSFIHYTHTNSALQLFSSGATIRQIANGLASWLNLDWTSASEFTYSNGMGQILATVIETEPPSSDPVAGQNAPGPPIVINF
jgi:hypothetical protein